MRELFGAVDVRDVEARLERLGFSRERQGRFSLGKVELEIGRHHLADMEAVELEIHGRRGDVKKMVSIGGVLIDKASFRTMRERAEHTIESFERALKRRGGEELPATLEHLKAFLAAGETKKERAKEREQDREMRAKLDEVVRVLERARDAGLSPEGIILYVDGPDGAGKSSTGGILLEALERAGFATRSETFKAPTPAERKKFWLDRFKRGVPKKGEAVYWDRGPAGDAAYGNPSARTLSRMAKDVEKFDADLVKRGILVLPADNRNRDPTGTRAPNSDGGRTLHGDGAIVVLGVDDVLRRRRGFRVAGFQQRLSAWAEHPPGAH